MSRQQRASLSRQQRASLVENLRIEVESAHAHVQAVARASTSQATKRLFLRIAESDLREASRIARALDR